jgi:hypothetical protein
MSGLGIRLYTDEDVNVRLAQQLRRDGYDVLTCLDAGNANRGLADEEQLSFAVGERRAILIHNIPHYAVIHGAWQAQQREHYGVIAVKKTTPLGELVRRTRRHLETVRPADQYNAWRFLAP